MKWETSMKLNFITHWLIIGIFATTLMGCDLAELFDKVNTVTKVKEHWWEKKKPLQDILKRKLTREANTLHNSLRVVDLHADTILWGGDLFQDNARGHLDIPRLLRGGTGLQVFATVTHSSWDLILGDSENVRDLGISPSGDPITQLAVELNWPEETKTNYLARTLYMASLLKEAAAKPGSPLRVIRYRSDLEGFLMEYETNRSIIAGLLAMEGVYTSQDREGPYTEDQISADFATLFDAGIRMMSVVHFVDNKLSGSSNGIQKNTPDDQGYRGTITGAGKHWVELMVEHGVIVDLAHLSSDAVDYLIAHTNVPLVRSHGGVRYESIPSGPQKNCAGERNLSDNQIIGIANSGGVIGIGYWDKALCPGETLGPWDTVRAMKYVVNLLNQSPAFKGSQGVDHVALGSDFDGLVKVWGDAAHINLLTQELLNARFSHDDIRKIMGENALRVFSQVLPERPKS